MSKLVERYTYRAKGDDDSRSSFPTRVCKQEASVAGGHWAILIQQRSK